jgi:hypothetical protein
MPPLLVVFLTTNLREVFATLLDCLSLQDQPGITTFLHFEVMCLHA